MIRSLAIAAFAAGTASIFSDWLFMGVLFHNRYARYPDVWWPGLRGNAGDTRAIVATSALGYVMAGAAVALCAIAGVRSIPDAINISLAAWAAGPLVLLVGNAFWIKTDPLVVFAHAVGWLVRFLLAGIAAGVALG